VRSSSMRKSIPTARTVTFQIVLGAAGRRVVSSRGLISEARSGSALYQDKVYFETLDAKVVALNPKTGKVIWENQVADNADGYDFNQASMIVKGKIVMGTKGGSAMLRRTTTFGWAGLCGLCVGLLLSNLGAAQAPPPEPPQRADVHAGG
jgi:PQQ-like domain